MKAIVYFVLLSTGLILHAQDVEVYDSYDDFADNLIEHEDKTYVVNFWATWCAPCIKELPYFEELRAAYIDKDVEVVLVSIDFKNQYERSLLPFLKRKKLSSRVIHMADTRSNIWVDKVDPSWSGAIPATLLLKGNKRLFLEKEFPDYKSLRNELDQFLNK